MMGFPGDYSTFRTEFHRATGSSWDAVFHYPWQNGVGWSVCFTENRTWAVTSDPKVRPETARCGKAISQVYRLVWGATPIRVWQLDPLSARTPQTFDEAYPRALARRRPSYLKLMT